MPPKGLKEDDVGLLEYLEDIIGSSIHKAPILQIEQELETKTDLRSNSYLSMCTSRDAIEKIENEKNLALNYLNTSRHFHLLRQVHVYLAL